jgi:hypothetical protein
MRTSGFPRRLLNLVLRTPVASDRRAEGAGFPARIVMDLGVMSQKVVKECHLRGIPREGTTTDRRRRRMRL